MNAAFLIFCLSTAIAVWSWFTAGAVTDWALVVWLSAIAAAILTLAEWLRGGSRPRDFPRAEADPEPRPVADHAPRARATRRPAPLRDASCTVLIDGSNVLYWRGGKPLLDSVAQVARRLEAEGLVPLVGFDANVGYLIENRYMNDRALAARLKLPVDQVSVSPKGQPADPLLIAAAVRLGARIVTNDRYRDWIEQFPQIQIPGFLVGGQIRGPDLELAPLAA
ncbi:MAG: hypothetical protein QM656_15895 [Paracoccaceae bacterium]